MRQCPWQGPSCRQASLSDLGIPYRLQELCALWTVLSATPRFFCLCLSLGSCITLLLAATRRPHSAALGIWTIHLVRQVHGHLCHLALGSNNQEGSSWIFVRSWSFSYNPSEQSSPEAAFMPRTEDLAARK